MGLTRLALFLLALAWLVPSVLFLGWAFREVVRDLRERAESAEMRAHQRRQDAMRRALDSVPIQRNGRAG